MQIRTHFSAWLVCSLLTACAPQTQRPATGRLEVPAAATRSAPGSLKFTEDYDGHICQVGTASCLSLDSRPFAPCWVSEPCQAGGEVVQAGKLRGDKKNPRRE